MLHRNTLVLAALLALGLARPALAEPDAAALRLTLATQAAQIRALEQALGQLKTASATLRAEIAGNAQAPAFAALQARIKDGNAKLDAAAKTGDDVAKRVQPFYEKDGALAFPVNGDANDKSGWRLDPQGGLVWNGEDGVPVVQRAFSQTSPEVQRISDTKSVADARANGLAQAAQRMAALEGQNVDNRLASIENTGIFSNVTRIENETNELVRRTSWISYDQSAGRTVLRNGLLLRTYHYLGDGDGTISYLLRFGSGGVLSGEYQWQGHGPGTAWTISWDNGRSTGLKH